MLYIRMFISMVVGLYTSRVVLATLGVEDYGIYGVVGGVVSMLGFLNASMSGATSRFLTYELGRGNADRLAKTFSSALIVHIGIALIVLVLAETVGLWFLCSKLNIPEARMEAAHWVYQLSILSAMIGITQVPYNACIIAHEKMDVYAYMEILNVSLKLLIVYLLCIGDFDKLKLYAVLTFAVGVLIMMIYRIYSLRHFPEAHFHWIWDKTYLRPLLSFSGWNLFGNFGGVMGQQGNNMVINTFWGVILNAASGIALTISGIVTQFASNAMTAFRPPITKLYAQKDIKGMQELTMLALKIIMFLYSIVAIPVFAECDNLLSLWLVKVPDMATVFCRIILISVFFETIRYIIIIDIHASGNVKWVSAFSGGLFCLSPLATYILYRLNAPSQSAFMTLAIINAILIIINIVILKRYIPQIELGKFLITVLKIVASACVALIIINYSASLFKESLLRLIATSVFSLVIQVAIYAGLCLNAAQRNKVLQYIRQKAHL